MHMHCLTDRRYKWVFALLIANGVTGVRDMGNNLSFAEIDSLIENIARGTMIGPRIAAHTGKILDGIAAVSHWPVHSAASPHGFLLSFSTLIV